MALTKYRLGDLIELSELRNSDNTFGISDVKGMSVKKEFIETKADMNGVSLKPYLLVKPDYFSYVTVTSRNSEKITLAHNISGETYIVSSSYIVFYIKRKDILNSDYLFMYFNRPEFDRYTRFNSWGSARETFSWDEMCDIELELPPIEIQQKYVDIYNAMLSNQKAYEQGLDDLKLTCDAYIENNIDVSNYECIGSFIELNNKRNNDGKLSSKDIMGFDVNGDFIAPKRVFAGNIESFRIIGKNDFVYNPRIPTITYPVALNKNEKRVLVSPAYVTFHITKKDLLDEEYLLMILQRDSFSRKVLFNTWGSSTPFLRHDDLSEIKIPVPNISIQKSIVNVFKSYNNRRIINEKLKLQIKDICPILIKGSLEESAGCKK